MNDTKTEPKFVNSASGFEVNSSIAENLESLRRTLYADELREFDCECGHSEGKFCTYGRMG